MTRFAERFRNIDVRKTKKLKCINNKGVYGTIVYLTNLHTWNLHRKLITFLKLVRTVLVPYLKIEHDSIYMFIFSFI